MKKIPLILNAVLLQLLTSVFADTAFAEIYKYQDEHGCWHFTDKPEQGEKVTEFETSESKPVMKSKDLASGLLEKYKPNTPIERASLAVIAVQSPLVEGSGFFISENGHILTNKHLVRPKETEQWKELEGKLNNAEIEYKKSRREYRRERDRLEEMEQSLKQRRKEIDRIDESYEKLLAESEYKLFKKNFEHSKNNFKKYFKDTYAARKREYEKARREFSIFSSTSVLLKDFKITLKDETEFTARLIAISDQSDLALLKIDRCKTPYIKPGNSESLRRGMKVYAIGSPLGIKDVITSGIIAGFKDEYLITDATILPGSSGGPLLTEDGKVVGINSIRVSQVIGGEGFGVAISIEAAHSEFEEYIQ